MKILKLFALGSIILLPVADAWQQLGPAGVNVRALSNVLGYPDELFIIVGGFPSYLYFTSNTGLTWTVRETIPDLITSLAINPNDVRIMYAGGRTRRIYKSTNSGYSWFATGNLPAGIWIQQLAVNPTNASEIWAIAEVTGGDSTGFGFYFSTDGGANWQGRVLTWSFMVKARALTISPTIPGRVLIGGSVGNHPRLSLTTDFGNNWLDRSAGLGGKCVYGCTFVPTDSSSIVCATDSGIYRSTDLGLTWTHQLTSPVYSVAFAPVAPYNGYAGGENLVYRTTDMGMSWRTDTVPPFTGTGTRFIAINPNRPLELFVGNEYGVFYSTNGGYDWVCRSSNFRNLDITFLNCYNGDTLFAGVKGYGILHSTNAGLDWQLWGKMFPGVGWVKSLAVNRRNPDTVVCVTDWDSKLHLTINRGDSWQSYQIADNFQPAGVAYHPRAQDTLYSWGGKPDSVSAPLRFAVYRSTDRGQHWNSVMVRDQGFCYGMIFSATGDTLIAYGSNGPNPAVFRSVDRGRTWSSLVSGISGSPVTDLKISPADPGRWLCATPMGVFKTENYGSFWTNLGLSDVNCVLPDTISPNVIWAGTDTQGFFYTTNQGVSWLRDTLGLPGRSVSMLLSHPQHRGAVYAGISGHSLLGKNLFGINELISNYQEPAVLLRLSPTTTKNNCRIIVHPTPERVELYDGAGRLREKISVPETGVVNWHRSAALPDGVYLLLVKYHKCQLTEKLILLR